MNFLAKFEMLEDQSRDQVSCYCSLPDKQTHGDRSRVAVVPPCILVIRIPALAAGLIRQLILKHLEQKISAQRAAFSKSGNASGPIIDIIPV